MKTADSDARGDSCGRLECPDSELRHGRSRRLDQDRGRGSHKIASRLVQIQTSVSALVVMFSCAVRARGEKRVRQRMPVAGTASCRSSVDRLLPFGRAWSDSYHSDRAMSGLTQFALPLSTRTPTPVGALQARCARFPGHPRIQRTSSRREHAASALGDHGPRSEPRLRTPRTDGRSRYRKRPGRRVATTMASICAVRTRAVSASAWAACFVRI